MLFVAGSLIYGDCCEMVDLPFIYLKVLKGPEITPQFAVKTSPLGTVKYQCIWICLVPGSPYVLWYLISDGHLKDPLHFNL